MSTALAPLILACVPAEDLRSQLDDISVLTGAQILYDWNLPALAAWSPRRCWTAGAPLAVVMNLVLTGQPGLTWDVVNLRPTVAVTPIQPCDPDAGGELAPLPPCLPAALEVRR